MQLCATFDDPLRRRAEDDAMRVGWRTIGILAALAVVGGCGTSESDDPGPSVGQAVLPDLVPAPPHDVHTRQKEGRWSLTFSSILVNVGDGEFVLRATRDGARWHVQQQISYSESGATRVAIDTPLVWGGDGHEHWHVPRVATNRLVARAGKGGALKGKRARIDSKVGFCFFDFSRRLDKGPTEKVHSRESCGKRADEEISMGLSPGWGDTYEWVLPGQSIDLTGVPDGKYRLWAEADQRRRFREVTSDNNVTWVDFRLSTMTGGTRTALVLDVGPEPR